jgi:negative regulator of replication initiation
MELLQSEIREEAQAAHVDGQDRNPARGSETRRGEQSAIAAKHEQELRCVRNLLASVTFRTVRQAVCRLFVDKSLYSSRFEPFQQWGNNDGEIRAAGAGNDAYGLKGLSGVHVRLRFYPMVFLRAWRKYS